MKKLRPFSEENRGLINRVRAGVMIGAFLSVFPVPGAVLNHAWAQTIDKINTSPKVYSLNPCETKEFRATVKGTDGTSIKNAKVVWESTNAGVATVDKKGVVTGRTPGYSFIRPRVGKIKGQASSVFVRKKGTSPSC